MRRLRTPTSDERKAAHDPARQLAGELRDRGFSVLIVEVVDFAYEVHVTFPVEVFEEVPG